jgi:L-aspartate oxidase
MLSDDVLIIGSGIAALQLAVRLNNHVNVRILTKEKITTANSYLAQGGIAAAIGEHDDPAKHIVDSLEAGRFHNDPEVVKQVINEAPALIKGMDAQGNFLDKDENGNLLLGMEGAHSEKRIVHGGGDATGKNVVDYLVKTLRENVIIEEDVLAYECILNPEKDRCIGVKAKRPDGTVCFYYAKHVILATGGCGQLYRFTSNAKTVTGDGIAMAYLAGAELVDMEFIQFHPTLLYLKGETHGLISEAVRGEGAILVTNDGTRIMDGVHPLKDLGPRHIVSQTIYEYLKNGQNVYLDIRNINNFEQRFPSITSICRKNGIELSEGRIPVAPGSHFLMGGIRTDLIGRSTINGLYAIGEASCTGLHGANRLASNSLLEGLYQGDKLAEWLNNAPKEPFLKVYRSEENLEAEKQVLPKVEELKDLMMERTGIVRNRAGLLKQQAWLNQFSVEGQLDHYSVEELTTIFMLMNAKLITDSALRRTESRGGHFRSDYPLEDDHHWLRKSITHKLKEKNHEHSKTAIAT